MNVRGLSTYYFTRRGIVKAVDNVSFALDRGKTLGLTGESGCGKSTAALSIMRLVPPPGRIVGGEILLEGEDLLKKNEKEIEKISCKNISIIFQDAMNALNPAYTAGDQIAETLMVREGIEKSEALKKAMELMEMVGMDSSKINSYPHELSGGMRQRVMICIALSLNPGVVIADEATTGLDAIVEAKTLDLLKELQKKLNLSVIIITHSLPIVARMCTECAVMYAGKIVEHADTESIFKFPVHPYTQGLVKAIPDIRSSDQTLYFIPGEPPNTLELPPGCSFHPRCQYAKDICRKVEPPFAKIDKGHYALCHLADHLGERLA